MNPFPRETVEDTIKLIELWGGPHDGKKVRVPHDCDQYVVEGNLYQPKQAGDYARNRFRHHPKEVQHS